MNAVVNEPAAPPMRARIAEPGMAMAGKTGTAQVRASPWPSADGRAQERRAALGAARPRAVRRLRARSQAPRYAVRRRRRAWRRRRQGRRRRSPATSWSKRQQRDPARAAPSAAARRRRRRDEPAEPMASSVARLGRRRPVARPRSSRSINWGLVLLSDGDRRRRLRHALFGRRRQLRALGVAPDACASRRLSA